MTWNQEEEGGDSVSVDGVTDPGLGVLPRIAMRVQNARGGRFQAPDSRQPGL